MKILACVAFVLLILQVLPTTYAKGGRSSSRGSSSSSSSRSSSSSSSGSSSGSSRGSSSNRGSSGSYGSSSGSSSNVGSSGSSSGSSWGSSSNRGSSGSYGSNSGSSSNVGSSGSSSGSSWGSSSNRHVSSGSRYSQAPPINRGSGTRYSQAPPINRGSGTRYSQAPPINRGSGTRYSQAPPINRGSGTRYSQAPPINRGSGTRYSTAPPINRGTGSRYYTAPRTFRPRSTIGPRRTHPTSRGFFTAKPLTIRPSGRPPIRGGNIHNPLQTNGQNRQQYPPPSYPYYPPSFGQPIGAGSTYPKAHKKKGFLNQIFSPRKTTKLHSNKPKKLFGVGHVQPSLGMPSSHAPGMYPFIPVMAVKTVKPSSHSKHLKHWFLPHPKRKRRKWKSKSIFDDDYDDSRCFRPNPPENGYARCARDTWQMSCEAHCNEGYRFPHNTTVQQRDCFSMSGIWRPNATFPNCEFICELKCENGGKCKAPGRCVCDPEYRGSMCQFHILRCDIRSIAIRNRISWSCSHTRTETTCRVGCDPPRHFVTPAAPLYRCSIEGVWTPTAVPQCVMTINSTLPVPNPTMPVLG